MLREQPNNARVYGVLLRAGRVLMSAERVGRRAVLKFPGGAVEPGETPEAALVREFMEEGNLAVTPAYLLHVPGTLFSPWTHAEYTPIYYRVRGDGAPRTPEHESIELIFMEPEKAMASGRMAAPEILALKRALSLLAPSGAAGALAQQAAAVRVDAVRMEPFSQTVPVIGRLVARQSGIVAARIGGPIAEMRVSVGDRVKEGDVLATLDSARLERQRALLVAEVAESTAQIKLVEAQLVLRRQELARLEGLRNSAAFSKGRFEDTRQQVVVARTSVGAAMARNERALANLALAEIDLYNAEIRAPYAGVVTVEHTASGSYVAVGGPVVSMVSDRKLEIEADVPAPRIPGLEPGMVVSIALDDGSGHQAVVRAIVPEENPLTRTRRVRFTPDIEMTNRSLAVNETVVLQLPLGPYREVLTVHKDALITRQGQTFVYVAAEGKANLRPIRTGAAVGGRFEVISGVAPGDLTVIRGNERLRPGQDVTIGDAS